MSAAATGDGTPAQVDVDAHGRGWIEQAGADREPVLFALSGPSLVVGRLSDGTSDWYDLRQVTNVDALGDPVAGVQAIELEEGDRRLRAGWPVDFCDSVIAALQATLGMPSESAVAPVLPDSAAASPVAPAPVAETDALTSVPAPAPMESLAPVETPTPMGSPADAGAAAGAVVAAAERPASDSFAPASDAANPASTAPPPSAGESTVASVDGSTGAAALVLEDVTYLGGYPGQNKKRKKCTATLTRDAVEVSGPNGLTFRVPWDVVRTIEAQNADEARFRMNTKVHRDATALVLECDQDVTVLLEARDCPTIPLRGAIAQLVDELPVVVV